MSPHSQLLACCGLTVEYNPYLKLGCLENNSFEGLYYEQYNDLFKFWLHADGPEYIYDIVMHIRGLEKNKFPHQCAYCIELINDEHNIGIIKEIINDELPGILYRYKMRGVNFNV